MQCLVRKEKERLVANVNRLLEGQLEGQRSSGGTHSIAALLISVLSSPAPPLHRSDVSSTLYIHRCIQDSVLRQMEEMV